MPIIRVNKTKDYTIMSNRHLKEKGLSLKAKGLLSLMLSLPNDWDYSIMGLMTLSRDGKDSVMGALIELEKYGYLVRTKTTDEKGRFSGYDYDIYECPQTEKPYAENPNTENPNTENPQQININNIKYENINKESTKESPTDEPSLRPQKHKYGKYNNVLLTDSEYEKLQADPNGKDAIEYLSDYRERKGYKAKSDYLCIKKWVFDAMKEDDIKKRRLDNATAQIEAPHGFAERRYTAQDTQSVVTNIDDLKDIEW